MAAMASICAFLMWIFADLGFSGVGQDQKSWSHGGNLSTPSELELINFPDDSAMAAIEDNLLVGPGTENRRIILFGDSLSDTKNMWKKTNGLFPPVPFYWRGRFSNGPTWSEFLEKALGARLYNFAEAGARAIGQNNFYVLPPFLRKFWVQEVDSQLNRFLQEGFVPEKSDLFVIWIGGNDHLLFPGHSRTSEIIARIESLVQSLHELGAQKILLLNLPDVSLSPFHELGIGHILMPKSGVSRVVKSHNQALRLAAQRLREQSPSLDLIEIDIFGIIQKLMSNAKRYGFNELRFPCIGGQLMPGGWHFNPFDFSSLPQGICADPKRYFFWDPWHPSTKAHCLTAMNVLQQLASDGSSEEFDLERAENMCL